MNSIKGKIINYNQEINGEITFDNKILEVKETSESVEDYIIPVLLISTATEEWDSK